MFRSFLEQKDEKGDYEQARWDWLTTAFYKIKATRIESLQDGNWGSAIQMVRKKWCMAFLLLCWRGCPEGMMQLWCLSFHRNYTDLHLHGPYTISQPGPESQGRGIRQPSRSQFFGSRKADYLERSKNELIAQRMQIIRFFELGTNVANVLRIG